MADPVASEILGWVAKAAAASGFTALGLAGKWAWDRWVEARAQGRKELQEDREQRKAEETEVLEYYRRRVIEQDELIGRLEKARESTAALHSAELAEARGKEVAAMIEAERLRAQLLATETALQNARAGIIPADQILQAGAALVLANERGIITGWSPWATAIFHWTEQEIVGRKVAELIPKELQAQHQAAYIRALQNWPPQTTTREIIGRTKQGEAIPLTSWISGWRDNGHRVFIAIFRMRRAVAAIEPSSSLPAPPPAAAAGDEPTKVIPS